MHADRAVEACGGIVLVSRDELYWFALIKLYLACKIVWNQI